MATIWISHGQRLWTRTRVCALAGDSHSFVLVREEAYVCVCKEQMHVSFCCTIGELHSPLATQNC